MSIIEKIELIQWILGTICLIVSLIRTPIAFLWALNNKDKKGD